MQLNEEVCPVTENVLGELYRASPHALAELIDNILPEVRASLAVYCYRRAHLASIGLAIAASCDENNLTMQGGNLGADLFTKSRAKETAVAYSPSQRGEITLSIGLVTQMPSRADEEA